MQANMPVQPGPGGVPAVGLTPIVRQRWLRELIATWGFAQRNYYITKRYVWWELVWLAYTMANVMSIGYIGAGVTAAGGSDAPANSAALTTYLLVGALLWSYLSMLFDIMSETVGWERWEGTIEYTFMAPASRATHLVGTGIYAVVYGILRTALLLGVVAFIFGSFLLLISGVYYPIDVLPGWMQSLAYVSPVYYALEGIRATLLDGA